MRLSRTLFKRSVGLLVALELEQTAGAERSDVAVDVELGAGVLDVEVAHRQLTDAIEWTEGRVLDLLHAQALGRVRQVGPCRVDDRVVVAAAEADRHLARDR